MSHKHLNPTSEEVGFFFLDEFDRVYIQIIVPRVHIDIMYKYHNISLVQITASKERIMNKTVEYPYGYVPRRRGLIASILFVWILAIHDTIVGSITLEWIHTSILFYLLGSVIFLNGYAVVYQIMRDLGDSLSEKGKNLLENESWRYCRLALKRSILWPIFLFKKE